LTWHSYFAAGPKCTQFTGLDLLVAFSKFSLAPVPFCSEGGAMFQGSLVRLEAVVPHLGAIDLTGMYVYVVVADKANGRVRRFAR
jgi:hypothetical protein